MFTCLPCILIYNYFEGIYCSILHIVGTQERRAHLKQWNDYDSIILCGCKKPVMPNHLFRKLRIDKAEAIRFIAWVS